MSRALLLALLGLVWLAFGPWSIPAVALVLAVPRVRRRLPRFERPWRSTGIAAAALVAVAAVVVVVPDGWLPIPSTGGAFVTPSYEGRQVTARPVTAEPPAQNPWLAADRSSAPGPLGDRTEVDSAWYGLERCGTLVPDRAGRIIALCHDRRGSVLRVVDASTQRPLATRRLPDSDGADAPEGVCGDWMHLDNADRAVVAAGDRRIQVLSTSDADDEPDLTVDESWNLREVLPDGDCVVAVQPAWSGHLWWVSHEGRVGVLDPVAGGVQVLELDEQVTNPLVVDETGVQVVSDTALYRIALDPAGVPTVSWRTPYDRGVERKQGQLVQGSGSAPVLVDHNLVAITDNAEPRLHVVFHDRATGAEVCRASVFDGGESATERALVSVGPGVVVANNHGYESPRSAPLGFTPSGGIARVDQSEGTCRVVWTSDEVSPATVPAVSWSTGLVYAWTKRPSLWGVSAWYLTALDLRTGERAFSVRSGTGTLHAAPGSRIMLADDGSAHVGTLAGLVRVRDREREGS